MKIDIQTLVIILGITHLMQVLVFYHQYRVNKAYRGIGWWLLWSGAEVIGFAAILLRNIPSILPVVIVVQNVMIIAGTLFLYIGIKRFFNKTINPKLVISILLGYIIGLLYFLFIKNDIQFRSGFFSAVLALIAFITAYSLFSDKTKNVAATANFNALIFVAHGGIFVYRFLMIVSGTHVENFFTPTLFNVMPYFDAFIVSLLWTFGLIIMLNQRLNSEMSETNVDLQLIFNTSPDAAIITRLDDGLIYDINEGFTHITGYSRKDMIGKSTPGIKIWKNIAERLKVVELLKEKGHCQNFEAQFILKDGTEITGLLSAKIISLHDIPYIISITRDITERRRLEEDFKESELRFSSLFENMNDGVALHQMIYNKEGIPVNYRIINVNRAFEKHTNIPVHKACGSTATELYGAEKAPYLAEYNNVVANKQTYNFETHFKEMNKDFSISVISTQPDQFATIFTDISEQKSKESQINELLQSSENSRKDLLSILEDQMQAQELLGKSEARYRRLFESAKDGILILDAETGQIKDANPFIKEMLEFSRDELVGKELWEIGLFKDIIASRDSFIELQKNEYIRYEDLPLETKSGKIINVEFVSNVYKVGEQNVVQCNIRDITQRKQAEDSLAQEQFLVNTLLENIPDHIYFKDIESRFIRISKSMSQIFGLENPKQAIGKTDFDFFTKEHAQQAFDDEQAIIKSGIPVKKEERETWDNRPDTWVSTTKLPLNDKTGIIIGTFGISMDITELKHTEESLRIYTERLRNLHIIDQAILEAIESPEAIVKKALQYIVRLLNCQRATVGIFDFEMKDVRIYASDAIDNKVNEIGSKLPEESYGEIEIMRIGKMEIVENLSMLTAPLPIVQTLQIEGIQSFINVPLLSSLQLYGVLNIAWKNPRTISTEEIEVTTEVANQITIAIEQANLLTKTKRYATKMEDMVYQRTYELEMANKELEAFSYSVSHDLRAPLRHITGFIKLFLEKKSAQLTEEELGLLNTVSISAGDMGKLIDALLTFSRLNRAELQKERIDTMQIIQQGFQLFENDVKGRAIEIKTGRMHETFGDIQLIRQVWTNFISNAIKYTGKTEKAIIEIGSYEEGINVVYFIKDNGAGFNMKYADKLFCVFQRLHKSRDFEGVGIGLANINRIVSRHGGRCWAEGEIGKGAVFYFSLPKE